APTVRLAGKPRGELDRHGHRWVDPPERRRYRPTVGADRLHRSQPFAPTMECGRAGRWTGCQSRWPTMSLRMARDATRNVARHDLAARTHEFAEQVIRPVASEYDQRQEFPWSVLEEAATRGFYSPLFYRDLIGDPTGLSLPMFMEELFWGCAGIGLAIVMPALALSAIGQAATPEQMLRWAPECFGTPGDLKLAALAISEPEGGSDVRNLRTRAVRAGS